MDYFLGTHIGVYFSNQVVSNSKDDYFILNIAIGDAKHTPQLLVVIENASNKPLHTSMNVYPTNTIHIYIYLVGFVSLIQYLKHSYQYDLLLSTVVQQARR